MIRTIRKDRILSALLAAALALAAQGGLTGCTSSVPQQSAAPQTSEAQTETAASTESITERATGIAPDEIVATVDGNSAPAELLTYQVGYSCTYLDYAMKAYGGDGIDLAGTLPDGQTTAEYIRTESLEMLKQQLVLENLAAKHGITLSMETAAELAAQREADIAEYGEDGYLAEIYKLGLSEAGYERVVRANYLYQALYDAYTAPGGDLSVSDGELAAYAAENGYITADHILLPTIDTETREPLDEKTVADNRALAEDILARLRASDDPIGLFAELADKHSADPGRLTNPEGYTFGEGRMVDEFDSAARALGENEISDIVESEYGYHIILRRPLDAAAAADAVREEYFDVFFLAEVDKAEMELSPAADRFDVAAVYEALTAAQSAGSAAENAPEAPAAP